MLARLYKYPRYASTTFAFDISEFCSAEANSLLYAIPFVVIHNTRCWAEIRAVSRAVDSKVAVWVMSTTDGGGASTSNPSVSNIEAHISDVTVRTITQKSSD
jgi:hypothetical protein